MPHLCTLYIAALSSTTLLAATDPPRTLCSFDGFGSDPKLAEIHASTPVKAYFGCSEQTPCLPMTLKPGEPIAVYREAGEWTCGYHSGRAGAAPVWVRSADIRSIAPDPAPSLDAWLGVWNEGSGRIVIRRSNLPGKLALSGNASWHGAGENVHEGSFAGDAAPNGNHVHFSEDGNDSCTVDLTLINGYLVTEDNNRCGGANVRFMGIWRRGAR